MNLETLSQDQKQSLKAICKLLHSSKHGNTKKAIQQSIAKVSDLELAKFISIKDIDTYMLTDIGSKQQWIAQEIYDIMRDICYSYSRNNYLHHSYHTYLHITIRIAKKYCMIELDKRI